MTENLGQIDFTEENLRLRGGSVGKVLTTRAQRPMFAPLERMEKVGFGGSFLDLYVRGVWREVDP